MGVLKFILALLFNISLVLTVAGQYRQYFHNVTTDNGLSYNAISTINQDNQGFIWIGTKDGLNRYDGVNFKIYSNQNSALLGNGISKIFIDQDDQMWVGSYNGLYLYDEQLDQLNLISVNSNKSEGANLQVNDMIQAADGTVWIAAENGLYKLEDRDLIKIELIDMDNVSIKSLDFDENQHFLYLGSAYNGVWRYSLASKEVLLPAYLNIVVEQRPLQVRKIFTHQNLLYICTWGNGIFVADHKNKSWRTLLVKDIDLSDKIVYTMEIIENSMWIGLSEGLIKTDYPGMSVTNIFKSSSLFEYSLSGTGVNCVFQDRDKNLWFGTTDNGLSIIGHNQKEMEYNFYGYEKSLEDDDKNEIIGSGSIMRLDWKEPKNSKIVNVFSQYPNLLDQSEEIIVLGSFRNGFAIFNRTDSTTLINKVNDKNGSLSHDHVSDALIDGSKIYLTTWGGGLNIYDRINQTFQVYKYEPNDQNSLSDNDATSIVKQNDSIFWISTFGGGINRFDAKSEIFNKFQSEPFDDSKISSNDVLDLFIDSENLIWIGYWGAGLDFMDLNSLSIDRFSKSRILPSSIVTAIEEDYRGNIWFSTKKGICKYDRARNKVLIYHNGYSTASNAYQIGRSARDENYNLYFGGDKGYFKIGKGYNSEETEVNHEIVYTGFDILGDTSDTRSFVKSIIDRKNLAKHNEIFLAHDQNSFTFDFSLPIFPLEDRYFESRLIGFDSTWREIGNSTSVTFTNLNPGIYWLNIRCHTGDWETYYTTKSLQINIRKPWWATWWAFSLYTLIFVTLLYLFFIYTSRWSRIRSKLKTEKILRSKDNELNQLKERFFVNISHEIRTPLTLIINSIDTLSNKILMNKVSQDSFYSIKKNANHLLQLVNEVLDFKKIDDKKQLLNLVEDDFVSFCKEIYLSFKDTAERKEIFFDLVAKSESIPICFDRTQMEKVVYNLLSNAIKFTPSNGNVKLQIYINDDYLHFTVYNSGQKIDLSDQKVIFEPFNQGKTARQQQKNRGFGLGLYITKNIINQHGGVISVESDNSGTTFHVKLPLKNSNKSGTGVKIEENVEAYITLEPDLKEDTDFQELTDKTVLIVEDNEDLRSYLVSVFESYYQVLVAGNGALGLEIATSQVPDIVISDVMMPVMDGISMTKELKNDKRTSHIPVIILTARTSLIYKHEGYDTGADDYIIKPFNKSLLLIRVKNLLKNRLLVAERIQKDVITGTKDLALNSRDEEFLNELMKVIEENASNEDLGAKLIAHELGMSHSVVYKKIKFLTGRSLVEFIRDYKLKTAAKLIAELGYSVADASFQVGFSDTKYFSRIFKKRYGVNPSKYDGTKTIDN